MTYEEYLFQLREKSIKDTEQSQKFEKPNFKINAKAFFCFFQNQMVFKYIESSF